MQVYRVCASAKRPSGTSMHPKYIRMLKTSGTCAAITMVVMAIHVLITTVAMMYTSQIGPFSETVVRYSTPSTATNWRISLPASGVRNRKTKSPYRPHFRQIAYSIDAHAPGSVQENSQFWPVVKSLPTSSSPDLQSSTQTGTAATVMPQREFYKRRREKVNTHPYNYVIDGRDICNRTQPFLVIFVVSLHSNQHLRQAIRRTWGQVSLGHWWPNKTLEDNINVVFLFGKHQDDSLNHAIKKESRMYHDVVQEDFEESYLNLTLKSIMALRWTSTFCPSVKFIMKTDDDMIINIPYLIRILHGLKYETKLIMGPYNPKSRVQRSGRWALTREDFPFEYFPPYTSGAAYVIMADLVRDLYETSQYIPLINVEDVFITGILAKIVGARFVRRPGFAYWGTRRPTACDIIKDKVVTGTKMSTSYMYDIWSRIEQGPHCVLTTRHNRTTWKETIA